MKVIVCRSIGYGGLSTIKQIQSLFEKEGFSVVDHESCALHEDEHPKYGVLSIKQRGGNN